MWPRLAVWAARFVVYAIVYISFAAIWLDKTTGWKGLELFAMSIGFAIVATCAWLAAVAIGHYYIARQPLQFAVHPVLTALLFLAAGALIISNAMQTEPEWARVFPNFLGLVAGASAADAIVGFLLERLFVPRT